MKLGVGSVLLGALVFASPSQASLLTFAPPTLYESGVATSWVGSADFNEDGNEDIAIAERDSARLVLLLGRGDGAFPTREVIRLDTAPYAGAAADLNGDGHMDLVLAALSGIMVLHGKGDGTFSLEEDYLTSARPWSLAIADLDEDGRPDLIFPDRGQAVHVLWSSAQGEFSSESTYATHGDGPDDVVVTDLNHDGHLDLATSDYGHAICCWHVSVFLGQGSRSFAPAVTYLSAFNPVCIAAGDINQDGSPDLFDPGELGNFSALVNRGDGSFDPAGTFVGVATDGVWDATLADLDLDGRRDIVAGTADGVLLVRGLGNAQFELDTTLVTNSIPTRVVAEDLDHDTRPDIVAAGNGVSVFLNLTPAVGATTSSPRFALAPPRPNPAHQQVSFDFSLSKSGQATLGVYDLAGRFVASLASGRLAAGPYQAAWSLVARDGRRVPAGVYFARLSVDGQEIVKRVEVLP